MGAGRRGAWRRRATAGSTAVVRPQSPRAIRRGATARDEASRCAGLPSRWTTRRERIVAMSTTPRPRQPRQPRARAGACPIEKVSPGPLSVPLTSDSCTPPDKNGLRAGSAGPDQGRTAVPAGSGHRSRDCSGGVHTCRKSYSPPRPGARLGSRVSPVERSSDPCSAEIVERTERPERRAPAAAGGQRNGAPRRDSGRGRGATPRQSKRSTPS